MRTDNFPGIHQAALGKFEPAFDVFPPGRSVAVLPQIAPDALFAAAQLDIVDCIEDGGIHRMIGPAGIPVGVVIDRWDFRGGWDVMMQFWHPPNNGVERIATVVKGRTCLFRRKQR